MRGEAGEGGDALAAALGEGRAPGQEERLIAADGGGGGRQRLFVGIGPAAGEQAEDGRGVGGAAAEPARGGMRFTMRTRSGSGARPSASASASTARQARLPASAGTPSAKGPAISIAGALAGRSVTSSARARVWRMVARSW